MGYHEWLYKLIEQVVDDGGDADSILDTMTEQELRAIYAERDN